MRNFLFYLFAVLAFAMVSCEMPEGPVDDLPDDPNTEQPGDNTGNDDATDVVFELITPAKVDVEPKGGGYTIEYSLTGVSKDAVIDVVVANKEMITSVDASEHGRVGVQVSANITEAARDGIVLLRYESQALSVVFGQGAGEGQGEEKPGDDKEDDKDDGKEDDKGEDDTTEVVFELITPSVVDVEPAGGDYTIEYSLTGVSEDAAIEVEVSNKDMITRADSSLMGYVDLFFSVNTDEASRECAVLLKYEEQTLIVLFKQRGAEQEEDTPNPEDYTKVELVADGLYGNYYGDKLVDGLGHYWLIFSGGSDMTGDSYMFRMDILGPMSQSSDSIVIPDGVYRFDAYNSYREYTMINIGNTDVVYAGDYGEEWAYAFDNAVLTVSGNHFDLVAEVGDKQYHVTYDGSYNIAYSVINDYISSLTRDTVIDVSNCSVSVSSYGDYWNCGYNNWGIEFVCNDGMKYGTYLVIDFLNSSTKDFTGTYVASGFSAEDPTKPDFRSGVFVPGFRVSDVADLMLGSLYMIYKDGLCVSQAPLYTGSVDIKYNHDGTYTIKIDAYDDAPRHNKLTLNWTGVL